MNHSLIRIISRYTAIDEDRHHYDLDGFPDLDCYFIPPCNTTSVDKVKVSVCKDNTKTKKSKIENHNNIL